MSYLFVIIWVQVYVHERKCATVSVWRAEDSRFSSSIMGITEINMRSSGLAQHVVICWETLMASTNDLFCCVYYFIYMSVFVWDMGGVERERGDNLCACLHEFLRFFLSLSLCVCVHARVLDQGLFSKEFKNIQLYLRVCGFFS